MFNSKKTILLQGLPFLFVIIIVNANLLFSEEIFNEFTNNKELHRIHREITPIQFGTTKRCIKEIPVTLLKNSHDEFLIKGNGSNQYLAAFDVCCEGFKEYLYNSSICVPDCGDKCDNGFCIGPGQCECFPTFIKNEFDKCVETCPVGCENGKCDSNGICKCENYENFQYDADKNYCKPICNEKCNRYRSHQICAAPDYCVCKEGYKISYEGYCIPECKEDCYIGKCIAPNTCVCSQGLHYKDGICQSNCHGSVCTNGYCEGNGKCKCFKNYKYDEISTTCVPTCEIDCDNGICVGPNKCKCFKGYAQFMNKGPCLKLCDPNCCVKPGICDCPPNGIYTNIRNLNPGAYCVSS